MWCQSWKVKDFQHHVQMLKYLFWPPQTQLVRLAGSFLICKITAYILFYAMFTMDFLLRDAWPIWAQNQACILLHQTVPRIPCDFIVWVEFFSLIFRFYVSFQSFQPCFLILQNLWRCASDVLQAVEVKMIKYVSGKLHMGILKEREKRKSVPVAVSSL